MDKREIIERLKNIAKHAVHTVGEKPFVMSLDDGIAVNEAIELLKKPERKTGRWIPCSQNASWLYVYKCSECGGYLQISDVDGKGHKANYCSYCGAKMEGDEADE